MRRLRWTLFVAVLVLLAGAPVALAQAQQRFALLVGNQGYSDEIGRLDNPHNDIARLESALKSLKFDVRTVADAGFAALQVAVNAHARRVRAAGPGAISFFYFAGHGAADTGNVNYLIPVDVKSSEENILWDQSLRLRDITRKLKEEADEAIHFVVFDACRNVLKLRRAGTRAYIQARGYVPEGLRSGMLIAYATAEGETAADGGAYAAILAEEIVKPGVEAFAMFRAVQLRVREATGEEPWMSQSALGEVYLAGRLGSSPPAPARVNEAAVPNSAAAEAWDRIKESTNIAILESFAGRFKDTFFAELARNRIDDLRNASVSPPVGVKPTSQPQAAADLFASLPKGPPHRVLTGAENLRKSNFARLAGKRVGLITNQTGLVGDEGHLADLLHSSKNVRLAAIFVPEHGWAGRAGAGEKIVTTIDRVTGVPIHSLYGDTRKPTREMLKNIDVLLFDVQDIGVRFYTYISTLGRAMQAAAAERIPFIILDRPNPLGGEYVAGFLLENNLRSFVGQYSIPIVHGMTIGELGQMIAKKKLLPGLDALDLSIEPMSGWERRMRWPDLSGAWIPTSPAINAFDAALLYPGMGLLEATSRVNDGRGTNQPFRLFGAEWLDSAAMANRLNAQHLPGLVFESTQYTPQVQPGTVTNTRLTGMALSGVRVRVIDYKVVEPLELGIVVLQLLREQAQGRSEPELIDQPSWLSRLAGTKRLFDQLKQGVSAAKIAASWKDEVEKFKVSRAPFLLYK
jgi:uncharacterized protein YbbC (DUF1343 family)